MFVDTHCHLNFEWFEDDRAAVIDRARQAGVERILNPGIDIQTSKEAIALASSTPEVFAAVGVHPNDALAWNHRSLSELRQLADHPKVVAIGEIGLDYYRDRAPQHLQQKIFQSQLELAAEKGLPVVIHSRNKSAQDRQATKDVLDILGEWTKHLVNYKPALVNRPGVLHSYSGNLSDAKKAVMLNFRIGITGPVTFPKADDLRSVVAGLPVERLLIETDAPFLTPQKYRGKRNEPAFVRYVCEKIADIHGMPLAQFAYQTCSSAERLFNW